MFCLISGTGSNKSLHGKTVVLTGGNSGIGAETAKDLSNRGAEVFILCRDQVKVLQCKKGIWIWSLQHY